MIILVSNQSFISHRHAPQIRPSDVEVLSQAIVALGGQWRRGLTRDVTHLFATGTASEKYLTAVYYQKETRIKILAPQWFDDVVRLGVPTILTFPYEWPDPEVLHLFPLPPVGESSCKAIEAKASLYKSVIFGTSAEWEIPENLGKAAEYVDVWKGKRILFSVSLGLNSDRREALITGVRRYGGVVIDVKNAGDEVEKIDHEEVDVLVTKFRAGASYFKVISPY